MNFTVSDGELTDSQEVLIDVNMVEEEIGLVYFGARFYDPDVGRFITVDPKRDGQNWFIYCRDNPLKYIDPDGRKVYVYSMPIAFGHKHTFIVVENSEKFTSISLYPQNHGVALASILPRVKGKSKPKICTDLESELGEVRKSKDGKKSKVNLEAEIAIPKGMTELEFDEAVLDAAKNYPIEDRPYDADKGPNSNTFVDDVIESAGGNVPDIPGATEQNWGENEGDTD